MIEVAWYELVLILVIGGCAGALIILRRQLRDNQKRIKELREEKERLQTPIRWADVEAQKFYDELVNAKPTDVQVGVGEPIMRDGSPPAQNPRFTGNVHYEPKRP